MVRVLVFRQTYMAVLPGSFWVYHFGVSDFDSPLWIDCHLFVLVHVLAMYWSRLLLPHLPQESKTQNKAPGQTLRKTQ